MARKPTYERFDYVTRPAKHIERKMLLQMFQRLSSFYPIHTYRYIGFGAIAFVDFVLFHRGLGWDKMVSIENESDPIRQRRFYFNRPFKCVDLKFGQSQNVLPALSWEDPTVAWLDYDGKMQPGVLTDASTFASHAKSGSVFLVTVNWEPGQRDETGVAAFLKRFPKGERPLISHASDLEGSKPADHIRTAINNRINAVLATANSVKPASEHMHWRQLINIHYKDGARMLTVGGMLYDSSHRSAALSSAWKGLDIVRDGADPLRIEVGPLTIREAKYIERQLPCDPGDAIRNAGIPDEHLVGYREYYRYFPIFTEALV